MILDIARFTFAHSRGAVRLSPPGPHQLRGPAFFSTPPPVSALHQEQSVDDMSDSRPRRSSRNTPCLTQNLSRIIQTGHFVSLTDNSSRCWHTYASFFKKLALPEDSTLREALLTSRPYYTVPLQMKPPFFNISLLLRGAASFDSAEPAIQPLRILEFAPITHRERRCLGSNRNRSVDLLLPEKLHSEHRHLSEI